MADRPAAASLEQEVLEQVARQVRMVPWPVFLTSMVMATVALRQQPALIAVAWLGLVGLVLLARRVWLARPPRHASGRDMLRAMGLSVAIGVAHALILLAFPDMKELERAVVSVILVWLCTGTLVTTAGHPGLYLAYAAPVLGSVSAAWAREALSAGADRWLHAGMALLALVYLVVLAWLARDTYGKLYRDWLSRQREQQLNQDLSAALQAAEQANQAKTRFLAAASHDLRQPLHTLALFSASLQQQPDLPANSRDIVQHMDRSIRNLGDQLADLLDLSKLDAGIVDVKRQNLALAPFIQTLAQDTQAAASTRQLQLHWSCAPTLLVHSDRVLLGRIVRNLLDNALKYSTQGRIELHAQALDDSARGPCIELTVQDQGCGIPESLQQRVFEAFFQVNNPERDQQKGLGLGLSIVDRLCRLLDIDVALQSVPQQGTRVTLLLPMAQADTQPPTEDNHNMPADTLDLPPLTVLVIDDDADIRLAMQTLLQARGCTSLTAPDSDTALRITRDNPPDLVLADYRLRGEDSGLQAIARLREHHPGLPALLITGDIAEDRLQQAHQAGLKLLHKPVSGPALQQAMIEVLTTAD